LSTKYALCGEIVDQVILENRQAGAGRQNRGRWRECDAWCCTENEWDTIQILSRKFHRV